MTSSTHDLMKDRNNQGLQCNLCFLSKFRQPCLLSAKTTSCVVSYNMYKILHYYQEHMNWWLLFNIMKKILKDIVGNGLRNFFGETLPNHQSVNIVPNTTSNCAVFILKCPNNSQKPGPCKQILAFLKITPKNSPWYIYICSLSAWSILGQVKAILCHHREISNSESTYITTFILNVHMYFTNVDIYCRLISYLSEYT